MSKSKPTQQTVTNQPWQPAQQSLMDILSQAGGMYGQGGLTQQTQAGDAIRDLGYQQNPLFQTAQNTLQQTASGDMIGANPYLDQMFQRGAGQIQDVVNSQFGMSGRGGSPGHQQVMTRGLGDFATSLYGGAYNQERANQLQAAGMAPTFQQQSFFPLQQAQAIEQQQTPLAGLQNYLGFAQPIGALGSQSSQPIYQNQQAGALGGGLLGYGLLGSGMGALGGALLGLM